MIFKDFNKYEVVSIGQNLSMLRYLANLSILSSIHNALQSLRVAADNFVVLFERVRKMTSEKYNRITYHCRCLILNTLT